MLSANLTRYSTPTIGVLLYLLYPKELRINKSILKAISIVHNFALVVFSGWTFYSLATFLHTHDIVFASGHYFQNPEFVQLQYYFYLSKYYEFFDTFLLYLNGREPIFLQKYHHIGAVICWFLCFEYKVDFMWMPTLLNSFVHTIMYSYYLCCLLKFNFVRIFKQSITTMQLTQFIVLYSAFYFYYPPVETWFNYGIITIFAIYGIGLIILFGDFYRRSYLEKVKNKKGE